MRSILLHINDDAALEARLQVALDLAREFSSHVTCLQSIALNASFPSDFYGASVSQAISALEKRAKALGDKLQERLGREDASWDWVSQHGLAEDRLLESAVLNDLTVVGPYNDNRSTKEASYLVGLLATRSRTPVLVVPEACKGLDIDAPMAVAWNGAPEAANAIRAALPILRRAKEVHLLSVDESRENNFDIPPTSAASYLSRHDIASQMVTIPMEGKSIAKSLVKAAKARDASCLVMGAYGHSRLRETIFGGVTKDVLSDVEMPVLLSS